VVWRVIGREQPQISPDELAAVVAERSSVRLLIE
jgi:hypothetical protein